MTRRPRPLGLLMRIAAAVATSVLAPASISAAADDGVWQLNRPKVAGTLRLNLRERKAEPGGKGGAAKVVERQADWAASETAIVVCDMWDDIYCQSSRQRIGVLVPKMNAVLNEARGLGVMIIHAPSETMTMYADTSYRLRMQRAEPVEPPVPIQRNCVLDTAKEPPLPIDTSVSPCDDPVTGAVVRRFSREHPGLDITGFDGISDDGREIFNYCRRQGIKNIVIMGVHTNMCILGRSFGIRQLTRLGFNVALARDLTDAMYDPRQPPYVSHTRGTELVVEHIETYWCPSIDSRDLTRTLPASSGPASSESGH